MLSALVVARKVSDVYYGLSCAYTFVIRQREWRNALRSLRFIVDAPRPGPRGPVGFHMRVREMQRGRMATPARRITSAIFRAVASPDTIIWVAPDDISEKVQSDLSLYANDILPGDWDLQTTAIDQQIKHRSVVKRYRDGVPWPDTELFDLYAQLLAEGETIRGVRDLTALERDYDTRVDGLFDSLREVGFRIMVDEHGRPDIPHVHIGRDGRVLFGNNGNHRLMMAKV